jgi:hypothetical protein
MIVAQHVKFWVHIRERIKKSRQGTAENLSSILAT